MTEFERQSIDRLARIETKMDRVLTVIEDHERRINALEGLRDKIIGIAALAGALPGAVWFAVKEITK